MEPIQLCSYTVIRKTWPFGTPWGSYIEACTFGHLQCMHKCLFWNSSSNLIPLKSSFTPFHDFLVILKITILFFLVSMPLVCLFYFGNNLKRAQPPLASDTVIFNLWKHMQKQNICTDEMRKHVSVSVLASASVKSHRCVTKHHALMIKSPMSAARKSSWPFLLAYIDAEARHILKQSNA